MRDAAHDGEANATWTEVQRAANIAVGYRVAVREDGGRRRVRFEPFFSSGDAHLPPPASELSSELLDCWDRLAEQVHVPFASAGSILYCSRLVEEMGAAVA